MTCGEEVQQRINGVIKYLPLGSDKINWGKLTNQDAIFITAGDSTIIKRCREAKILTGA